VKANVGPGETKVESGGLLAEKAVERFDPEGWKRPQGEWGSLELPERGRQARS